MNQLPFKDWCESGGLALVSFPTKGEYLILRQLLESLKGDKVNLIHSKPIRSSVENNTTLIDMSGHDLTPRSALRRRIKDQDSDSSTLNPADTQGFLSLLDKMTKKASQSDWWVWWSPSDLIAHGVDDIEISQCMRAIGSDFADYRFLALIPEDVHTKRGFAIMEYVAEIHFRVEELDDNKYVWRVVKHYNEEFEGAQVEF